MADPQKPQFVRKLGALGGRTLALLGVIVIAIAVGYKFDVRADWSADGRFSLAPEMIDIVSDLTDPVELVSVWSISGDRPMALESHDFFQSRLQRIADLNPRISYRHIDDVDDQLELEAFRDSHGEAVSGSIYAVSAGSPFRVPITGRLRFVLQREIAGALVTASSRDRAPIYVLQGHGELPVSGAATDTDTLGHLIRRLELAGFEFDPKTGILDEATLSRRRNIFGDGLLIIAGPTAPLGPETSEKIHDYLRDGGAALIFADHRCPDDLALILRRWGVLIAGGHLPNFQAVVDGSPSPGPTLIARSIDHSLRDPNRDFSQLLLAAGRNIPALDVTQQTIASGQNIMSPFSSPVLAMSWNSRLQQLSAESTPPTQVIQAIEALDTPPIKSSELLLAVDSEDSWVAPAEIRQPPPQTSGTPIPIGFIVEWQPHERSANPGQTTRLAIWGSRDAATDRWVGDPVYANDLLIADLSSWALDRGQSTPIAAQDFASYQVDVSEDGLNWLLALLVALIPCVCLGGAMLTWWDRR